MPTKKDELIQEYGRKLAQQALWSPETIRQITTHALAICANHTILPKPSCDLCYDTGIIQGTLLHGLRCCRPECQDRATKLELP